MKILSIIWLSIWLSVVVSCAPRSNSEPSNLYHKIDTKAPQINVPIVVKLKLESTSDDKTKGKWTKYTAELPNKTMVEPITFSSYRVWKNGKRILTKKIGIGVRYAKPIIDEWDPDNIPISEEDFFLLVDQLLNYAAEHNMEELRRLDIDLRLIGPVWESLLPEIRKAIQQEKGVIRIKEGELQKAFDTALSNMNTIKKMCDYLLQKKWQCRTVAPVYTRQAVRYDYQGKPWSDLLELKDLGINPYSYFSLKISPFAPMEAHNE